MRRCAMLLFLVILSAVSFAVRAPSKVINVIHPLPSTSQQLPLGTIDGSVNPEMISDYQAYSMFFRFISNRPEAEKSRIRAYLRQLGLGECPTCPGPVSDQANARIDVLLAAAEEFYIRVHPLDLQITEIVRQNEANPTPLMTDQLNRLRREKETICAEMVASLSVRLGAVDAERVRSHIENMKRKMKVLRRTH